MVVQWQSCAWLFVTPWTVAQQAPLSMELPRQEYWSGLPFPSPGDFSQPKDWTCLSGIGQALFWVCLWMCFWMRLIFKSADEWNILRPLGWLSSNQLKACMGSQRGGHDWACTHTQRERLPGVRRNSFCLIALSWDVNVSMPLSWATVSSWVLSFPAFSLELAPPALLVSALWTGTRTAPCTLPASGPRLPAEVLGLLRLCNALSQFFIIHLSRDFHMFI